MLKGYQKQGRNFGTNLVNPDFCKLFESYGVGATRVKTVAELSKTLEGAVAADQLQLIEVSMPNGFGALV